MKITLTINGEGHLEGWPIGVSFEVDDETARRLFSKDAEVQIFMFPAGDERGSLFGECHLQYEDTPP